MSRSATEGASVQAEARLAGPAPKGIPTDVWRELVWAGAVGIANSSALDGCTPEEYSAAALRAVAPQLREARSLAQLAASLDEYIERRAQQLAGPRIRRAEREAEEKIAAAERKRLHELQRWNGVEEVLRQQVETLHRNLLRYVRRG